MPAARVVQILPPSTRRTPGPIAAVIPEPAPVAASPGLVDQVSQYFQQAFPTINRARVASTAATNENIARGDYARAAGNVASGFLGETTGLVTDLVGRPALAIARGAGNFLGGLAGSRGSTAVVRAPAATPNPVVAAATNPTSAALAAGRAATVPADASSAISDFIRQRFAQGVTNHDIAALSQLAPAAAALARPTQTQRDARTGISGTIADALFQQETNAAMTLPEGSAERAAAVLAATQNYYQRNAALAGVNPQANAQAALLAQAQGD